MTSLRDKQAARAYANGYLDGILEGSWICDDCGNRYGSDVEHCPNAMLDVAKTRQEAAERGAAS